MYKSQIIQRLLDEKHITVEEAMTLMQTDTVPVVVPNHPTYPCYPPNIWCTTSTGTTTTKTTLND